MVHTQVTRQVIRLDLMFFPFLLTYLLKHLRTLINLILQYQVIRHNNLLPGPHISLQQGTDHKVPISLLKLDIPYGRFLLVHELVCPP